MDLETTLRLLSCAHQFRSTLANGMVWCNSCGALQLGGDGQTWHRPSLLCVLDMAMGSDGLRPQAERCLTHLRSEPMPALACMNRFGHEAFLQLVWRNLVDVDGGGTARAKESNGQTQ